MKEVRINVIHNEEHNQSIETEPKLYIWKDISKQYQAIQNGLIHHYQIKFILWLQGLLNIWKSINISVIHFFGEILNTITSTSWKKNRSLLISIQDSIH